MMKGKLSHNGNLALRYARDGIPVFPVSPMTKAPLVKGGFKSATLDEAQISAWWSMWPEALVSAPTGSAA